MNVRDKFGITPLIYAVYPLYRNDVNIARILINAGADINEADNKGQTPLMHSIKLKDPDRVKFLLDYGANVNATDKDGNTALTHMLTKDRFNPKVATLLLDAGAKISNVNITSKEPEILKFIKEYIESQKNKTVFNTVQKYLTNSEIKDGEKVGIRKLSILQKQLCENISTNVKIAEIKGMAKALKISDYESKNKEELCSEIGAKLLIYESTGTLLPIF